MKKVILAIATFLVVAATSAFAGEYMGITGEQVRNTVTKEHTDFGVVAYGRTLGAFDVEGRVGVGRTVDTKANSEFVEARALYSLHDVKGFVPWVRATVGEQYNNGTNYAYWAVEPGVGYKISNALRADVSALRTQTINSNFKSANQTQYNLGATYALDNKNNFGVQLDKTRDSVKATTFEVSYKRAF